MKKKYIFLSLFFHALILIVLVLSVEFSAPMVVVENTNKNDVISAVILGDTTKSKIIPQKIASPPPPVEKPTEKPVEKPKVEAAKPEPKEDVIALNDMKKKLAKEKVLAEKKRQELLAKELLSDLKKQADTKKKIKQEKLKKDFAKSLKEQAEKSLRQQMLDEDIKLKGKQLREAQGVVNKYQALIIQAISEHWLVPPQANKKLYCLLMIRLSPGGMVLDVQVTKSSGDPALDSSARAAVLKASPLPVPKGEGFEPFRQFVLKVKPENVVGNGIG